MYVKVRVSPPLPISIILYYIIDDSNIIYHIFVIRANRIILNRRLCTPLIDKVASEVPKLFYSITV